MHSSPLTAYAAAAVRSAPSTALAFRGRIGMTAADLRHRKEKDGALAAKAAETQGKGNVLTAK